ncbi:MAG: 16S rRNA (cytidine(1402)-2'-O)-methyltransferase [Vicinamibacterales bacterium]
MRQRLGRIHLLESLARRMSGILYVVATPIGNLEDMTLRALRILRSVAVIAAEDTRRTARLLQHYSISSPTTSLHEHNERTKSATLVARLLAGDSVALVSDAGTPLISDPGRHFVAAARAAGIRIDGIPGPSAIVTALSISGLEAAEFTFLGFPPIRSTDRFLWMARAVAEPRLVVFFEAPHRIRRTLQDLGQASSLERTIAIGRELSKAHEEMVIRPISEILAASESPKGEYTILLPPYDLVKQPIIIPEAAALINEFCHLIDNMAVNRRAAMKILADKYGMSVNDVYRALVSSRKSVE